MYNTSSNYRKGRDYGLIVWHGKFFTPCQLRIAIFFLQLNDNQARIFSNLVLPRSDKRKDRVEISPGNLCEATIMAPAISQAVGEDVNIIGWYHSHPHITVEPSHVDLQTQLTFQNMDSAFVGLIFSVFNTDRNLVIIWDFIL